VRLWLHKWGVEEMGDGGGHEKDHRPEEKRECLPGPVGGMNKIVEKVADAGVAGECPRENPGGNHGKHPDNTIIKDGSGSVDAAKFVIGNVNGPAQQPKAAERKEARCEALPDFILADARKKNGSQRRPGSAKSGEVFIVIGTDAKRTSGEPDKPSDGISEEQVEPDLFFQEALQGATVWLATAEIISSKHLVQTRWQRKARRAEGKEGSRPREL